MVDRKRYYATAAMVTSMALAGCANQRKPLGIEKDPTPTIIARPTPTPEIMTDSDLKKNHVVNVADLNDRLHEEKALRDSYAISLPVLPEQYELNDESVLVGRLDNFDQTAPLHIPLLAVTNFVRGENGRIYGYRLHVGGMQRANLKKDKKSQAYAARTGNGTLIEAFLTPAEPDNQQTPEVWLSWYDQDMGVSYAIGTKSSEDAFAAAAPAGLTFLEK